MFQEYLAMLYAMEGGDKLLYLPPFDNAMNIVDTVLMIRSHRSWADAFFKVAQLEKHMYFAFPPKYNVFSRSNSVICLTYTFDSKIKFLPG